MSPGAAARLASFAGLQLSSPALLWGLALVVPVVLLHLYRRRRLEVPFLPLFVEALGRDRPGVGWRRLRDAASLLVRVLAIVAGVLALSGLAPARAASPPASVVVVIDADVTARAVESDGRSRYEHALELALSLVRAEPWFAITVLEAREAPVVLLADVRRRDEAARDLKDRLDEVRAVGREAAGTDVDLEAALELARVAAASASPPRRIILLSARPWSPGAAAASEPVEVWGTGSTREDQGIVAFDVVEGESGARSRVRVSVRNDHLQPRERDLVLRLDSEEAERRRLVLLPGVVQEVEFEVRPPRGGAFCDVRLDGSDAFVANDTAHARLAPPARPSVLVVHGRAVRPYLRAVLEALGDSIDQEASGTVHVADLPRAGPLRDVVIVDGTPLPPGALRPGSWLFLAPLGGDLPFEVGSRLTRPLVWRTRPDHPLVRDLDLGTAYVVRGDPVSGEGLTALAEADGRAVLAEGERAGVRYVVLGLDPEESDLPLRAAFPLLVRGAIRRLALRPTAPLDPVYQAGDVLRPRLDLPGGPTARIRWPGGEARADISRDGTAWPIPAGAHGRVEVRTGEVGGEWAGATAFVDLDPARSIAPARPAHPLPPSVPEPVSEGARWRRSLLALAVLLLLADLFLLTRSRRRFGELALASPVD